MGKILEKSGNFVSPEKWELCRNKTSNISIWLNETQKTFARLVYMFACASLKYADKESKLENVHPSGFPLGKNCYK